MVWFNVLRRQNLCRKADCRRGFAARRLRDTGSRVEVICRQLHRASRQRGYGDCHRARPRCNPLCRLHRRYGSRWRHTRRHNRSKRHSRTNQTVQGEHYRAVFVILSLTPLGELPKCCLTYFPKKERLSKPKVSAISLMLLVVFLR